MSWVAHGDWGGTRLRLWQLRGGERIAGVEGRGVVGLDRPAGEELAACLAGWIARDGPPARVTLCGMAGSDLGLRRAGYVDCPVDAAAWAQNAERFTWNGLELCIGAGCAEPRSGGIDDVMRGEETQIFGALRLHPERLRGLCWFLLPGTHSKWVKVENGSIAGIHSFVTGELFALLRGSSLLAAKDLPEDGAHHEGFAEGLEWVRGGGALGGGLFAARAAQLRHGASPCWAAGYLSALLIASEIAEMSTRLRARAVTIIGGPALAERYARALTRFDVPHDVFDGDACVLAGLEALDEFA